MMYLGKFSQREEARAIFNKYYTENSKDYFNTLLALKRDGYDDAYFLEYFLSYRTFINEFKIPVRVFERAGFRNWDNGEFINHKIFY